MEQRHFFRARCGHVFVQFRQHIICTRHQLPIQMFCPHNNSTCEPFIVVRNNCKNFSSSRCSNISVDSDKREPEYLEIVTQTANRMRSAVRKYVEENARSLFDSNQFTYETPPRIKLVGILATKNAYHSTRHDDDDTHGNELYSEQIANMLHLDGIAYEPWRVPPKRESIERSIQHANERLDVHGILVFYPIEDLDRRGPYKCQSTGVYYKSMDDYFRDMVSPEKDVEGYRRKGLRMRKSEEGFDETIFAASKDFGPIYPCTALAVFRILESLKLSRNYSKIESSKRLFEGMTMTIINRSEVLGLPLAIMLSNQGATVYSIDKNSILKFGEERVKREPATRTIKQCVQLSSVVVSGVPSLSFRVPTEYIRENAILINVAMESNFEEEEVTKISGITYVPNVGRVTVTALELNLCLLHQNHHRDK